MVRITGSDPVHARSNRALAAKLNVVAESSGRMPDCLSGGTGSTPAATASGVMTRWGALFSKNEFKQVRILSPLPKYVKSEHGIAAGASAFPAQIGLRTTRCFS